ncbi:2-hydroxyacid dehydrogenase [Delftia lacustris]
MQPALLVLNFNTEAHLRQMAQAFPSFELLYAPDAAQCEAAIAEHGTRIQAVLTIGSIGLSAAQMQRMPALRLVCALGAGYENIDVAHAQAHGIAVGNGAGTNDDCVADHAMGLLIASVRGLVRLDRATRDGVWRTAMPLPPNVSHKRLGILGMGAIGAKIAQRALGFEMEIGYHNRSPRSELPHRYFGDLLSLAQWADVLVVATPGGPGTRHLINTQVLDALGPQGHLVNIARGSVVDTAALAAAVREGRLAGAGLDVYESEPAPPAELLDLDAVVLTPHVGGWSPEAVQASVDRFIANMRCHLEGRPLVSPVTA